MSSGPNLIPKKGRIADAISPTIQSFLLRYWHKLLLSHKGEAKKEYYKSKRLYDFSYHGPGEAGLDGIEGTGGILLWTVTSLHQYIHIELLKLKNTCMKITQKLLGKTKE